MSGLEILGSNAVVRKRGGFKRYQRMALIAAITYERPERFEDPEYLARLRPSPLPSEGGPEHGEIHRAQSEG